MLPIVPTFKSTTLRTTSVTQDGYPFGRTYFYERRYGHKQSAPYNIATTCSYVRGVALGIHSFDEANNIPYTSLIESLRDEATNKARAKFVSHVGSSSQFGSTATAEAKSTFGLVVSGTAKALRAAKLVASGRILEAGKLLDFNPPVVRKRITRTIPVKGRKRRKRLRVYREYWRMPDGREILRGAGSKWLWYSYGVSPLISDLYNASETLTRDFSTTKVVGRGQARGSTSPGIDSSSHIVKVTVVANVRVENPNIYLAQQLGFLNPIQWANEGIPLSFVIDWFSNWSDWINQLTDLSGLAIINPTTSIKVSTKRTFTDTYWNFKSDYFTYDRYLGVPNVKLRFAYERINWQRGANAISLLVQFLKKNSR